MTEKSICRFWDETKKECIWNFFILYYKRKEIVIGGLPFNECENGTGNYHPTLNTETYCKLLKIRR